MVVCPDCGKDFDTENGLKIHQARFCKGAPDLAGSEFIANADETGAPEPPPIFENPAADVRPKPPRKSRSRGSLAPEIKDAMLMTAAITSIRDPRIYTAVEATVDEFAVAWDNVAKQSPTARKYIQAMLSGGVWISAVGASLVMVVTTLACTENLPPSMDGLGQFALSKAGIRLVPQPVMPEPGPQGNGVVSEDDQVFH